MSDTTHVTDTDCVAIPLDDVAALLNISRRHAAALNASGRLPTPIRLGRSVRWRLADLRDWLAAGAPPRDRWETMRAEGRDA